MFDFCVHALLRGEYTLIWMKLEEALRRDKGKKMIFETLTDSWYPRKSTPGC